MIAICIFFICLVFAGVIASITHPLFKTWETQKEAYKIRPAGQMPPPSSTPLFMQILTCKVRNSMGGSLRALIFAYRAAFVLVVVAAIWGLLNL